MGPLKGTFSTAESKAQLQTHMTGNAKERPYLLKYQRQRKQPTNNILRADAPDLIYDLLVIWAAWCVVMLQGEMQPRFNPSNELFSNREVSHYLLFLNVFSVPSFSSSNIIRYYALH